MERMKASASSGPVDRAETAVAAVQRC